MLLSALAGHGGASAAGDNVNDADKRASSRVTIGGADATGVAARCHLLAVSADRWMLGNLRGTAVLWVTAGRREARW